MEREPQKLDGFLGNGLPKMAFVIGVACLMISMKFAISDGHHFFFSYLTSFSFFLSIALGGLFFVLIQMITRAGWSVVVRRISEHLMKNLPWMALLFIPILFGMNDLYHWTDKAAVSNDHLLQAKSGYLNVKFFLVRAVIFWGIWSFLANFFFKKSVEQDTTGDQRITATLQKVSAAGIALFALTISFASIDWIMSITPHWYSTMFGIYIFAGACVSSLAVIGLVCMTLLKGGYLKGIVTVEHIHDISKLLYGFNIFWAYIAFSQFFLIWYANIPEETEFFLAHFNGSWSNVATLLCVGHFGIPFIVFMSKHARRNFKFAGGMMVWLLIMHFVDIYWLIMPNISPAGVHVTGADVFCFLGIGGVFVGLLFTRMKSVSLFPCKDPRLHESLKHQV
jgi:hypothetical protein